MLASQIINCNAVETLANDTRQAIRSLRRSPFFTIVALLTLTIGIGASTAVFTVVDAVLLKPLPYPHPDELVALSHSAPGAQGLAAATDGLQMSPSMLVTYREHNRSFKALGVWQPLAANVTGGPSPSRCRPR